MSEPITKPQAKTRFYPNRSDFDTHAQWDAHRQLYDTVYAMQDEQEAGKKAMQSKSEVPAAKFPNQANNTLISGLPVNGNQPQHGQTLKWNANTGQIEWS